MGAVQRPPVTAGSDHTPSPNVLVDLDAACKAAGIMPDLVLSGHAHLYERYTRVVAGNDIPFVVAGIGGGFNLSGFKGSKKPPPPPGTRTPGPHGTQHTLRKKEKKTYQLFASPPVDPTP